MNTSISEIMFPSTTKLGPHHEVLEILGAGSFGQVAKCLNTKTQEMEAVKVVKSCCNALHELQILKHLRRQAPDASNIVRWNSLFFHEEMPCLSFELLDGDLFDILKCCTVLGGVTLSFSEVRSIIHQLATALDCLKTIGVIHGDLKPENILVVDRHQMPLKVKLADFGGAKLSHNTDLSGMIHTLNYCSPEILIKGKFNEAIDIWALGIVTLQLWAGSPLYLGTNAYDILRGLIANQGQPPDYILNSGAHTSMYFHRRKGANPRWILKTPEEYEKETGYRSDKSCDELVSEIIISKDTDEIELDLFEDLVERMVENDFTKRFTPQQVLQHPFFTYSTPQNIPPVHLCFEEKPVEGPGVIQQPSCIQSRWQEDFDNWLEVVLSSLSDPKENLEDAQLESPGNTQLLNPGDVQLENITEVELENTTDFELGTIADVELETIADVQVETTADDHVETIADVQEETTADDHVETTTDDQVETIAYFQVETTADDQVDTIADVQVETTADDQVETIAYVQVETIADVQVETTADDQVETIAYVQVETTADVQVETITDVQVETTADDQVEIIADVQVETATDFELETTADAQVEIPVDEEPDAHSRGCGCFMPLIRQVGKNCRSSFRRLRKRLMRFFRNG